MSKIGLISNVIKCKFCPTMLACDSSDAENEQKSLCLKKSFFFFTSGWIPGCLSCKSVLPFSHTVKLSSNQIIQDQSYFCPPSPIQSAFFSLLLFCFFHSQILCDLPALHFCLSLVVQSLHLHLHYHQWLDSRKCCPNPYHCWAFVLLCWEIGV